MGNEMNIDLQAFANSAYRNSVVESDHSKTSGYDSIIENPGTILADVLIGANDTNYDARVEEIDRAPEDEAESLFDSSDEADNLFLGNENQALSVGHNLDDFPSIFTHDLLIGGELVV